MASIAKQIKDIDSIIEYGKNNLEDFLIHWLSNSSAIVVIFELMSHGINHFVIR